MYMQSSSSYSVVSYMGSTAFFLLTRDNDGNSPASISGFNLNCEKRKCYDHIEVSWSIL